MGTYDKQLAALREAGVVAFHEVGIAARLLPVTEVYNDLARARDPALRPRLEELLDTATPAGQVYAAALLGQLDPAAGERAWQRLARNPAEISTMSGCIGGRTTLADYAAARLAGPRS